MIKKVFTLGVGVAGYVLGARAGRGRYEQIKTQADKVWSNPKVQQAASEAQDLAADKAPVIKEKAAAAAKKASSSAKSAADKAASKTAGAGKATSSSADVPEGIDLVAAASSTPEDPTHG